MRVTFAAVALVSLVHSAAFAAEPPPPEAAPASPSVEPAPPPAAESVVTATRLPRPLRDVPQTVVVLPREELERKPTAPLDAIVRSVPSVSSFRRSTSLSADPSSQGLSLRGIGPSATSRALLLVDGVPANDPFGGSIYWRAIPRLGLDRVEVSPGGASAVYGSSALGGVVQLLHKRVSGPAVDALGTFGNFGTGLLAGRAADQLGPVSADVEAEHLSSDGFPVVAEGSRGPIDGPAGSRHTTVNARAGVQPFDGLDLGVRGGWFDEQQSGGTQFTTSAVRLGTLAATADLGRADSLQLSTVVFGRVQRFRQDRARVAPERVSEVLAGSQDVPAQDLGGSAVVRVPAFPGLGSHRLALGVDGRGVSGVSNERLFTGATASRSGGGEQLFGGVFAEDAWSPLAKLEVVGALRLDGWWNRAGARKTVLADGEAETETFADRGDGQLSPRLSALYRATPWLSMRGSVYRAFRAPTLNELYRSFQVGTILTAGNDRLEAERLVGGELGAEVSRGGTTLRLTGFFNQLDRPISNVTLAEPLADGSKRQKQNLGAANIPGLEASVEARLLRPLSVLAAYAFTPSRVIAAPGHAELVGKQLAQDPAHRASAALVFRDRALFAAALEGVWVGPQFEDDLNTAPMGGYLLLNASLSRRLSDFADLFVAAENLLDRTYLVGRAGVDTVGAPRSGHVGLRVGGF